jgi:hypothetical protein
MNTFNLKRFWNYAKRDFYYSKNWYLGIVGILTGLFALSMIFYYLDYQYASVTFRTMIEYAGIIIFFVAPLIMEEKRDKKQAIFSNILPVSNFERFLNFWLKYIGIVHLICWITVIFLVTIYSYFTGNKFILLNGDGSFSAFEPYLFIILAFHSFFLLGYYFFKKYALVKTGVGILAAFVIYYFVIGILCKILGIQDSNNVPTGLWIYLFPVRYFNWLEIPVPPVMYVINYISRLIFPFGIWLVTYFKLKETEI